MDNPAKTADDWPTVRCWQGLKARAQDRHQRDQPPHRRPVTDIAIDAGQPCVQRRVAEHPDAEPQEDIDDFIAYESMSKFGRCGGGHGIGLRLGKQRNTRRCSFEHHDHAYDGITIRQPNPLGRAQRITHSIHIAIDVIPRHDRICERDGTVPPTTARHDGIRYVVYCWQFARRAAT